MVKINTALVNIHIFNIFLLKRFYYFTKSCPFPCNDQYFKQIKGLPMGNCLSPVLSNLYKEYFKKEWLPSMVDFDFEWYRYVDDIFAILPDNLNIQDFLAQLNSLSTSINFKVEFENNQFLPFLDVLIAHSNNLPSFAIHRKPSHSNKYIHAFSNHSDTKLGTISSLFLLANRICDMQNIDTEIQFIFSTFKTSGYDHHFLEKAHFRVRAAFYRINRTNDNQ